MRSKRADNILSEVRLVRVPDEAYSDYLWGVHEDPSDINPLATVALKNKNKDSERKKTKKNSGITQKQLHPVTMWTNLASQ